VNLRELLPQLVLLYAVLDGAVRLCDRLRPGIKKNITEQLFMDFKKIAIPTAIVKCGLL
jgi:hypothetical protein